ncbi:TetR/AcrR family transcriptional regulator [Opitutus sp. ER46]|uniref:TetR/AcrR family transcriptional regulator n=1 Tax=Opitutus sp. ER46 TaxID=2161864 RepID=UPI000D32707A|nr:TetR/AcrR family transcriptional regulator [Opitutus sp. ER46]PTX94462.1 TetR/AcrR family transcriptional regulator [Opitutus sp. ER46]
MPRRLRSPSASRPRHVRERLLRAATALFARAGYDGTTVDEVVARARVNKRMVYHYFGDKDGLYEAVLGEAYRSLEVLEHDAFARGKDLENATAQIVRLYFEFNDAHPQFLRLLLWENLNGGRGLRRAGHGVTKDPVLRALDAFLHQGIAAGRIRSDMDARQLLISLIGLCQVYSSNRYTLSSALGVDIGAPVFREQGIRHVTRLLLEGVKAPPRAH